MEPGIWDLELLWQLYEQCNGRPVGFGGLADDDDCLGSPPGVFRSRSARSISPWNDIQKLQQSEDNVVCSFPMSRPEEKLELQYGLLLEALQEREGMGRLQLHLPPSRS